MIRSLLHLALLLTVLGYTSGIALVEHEETAHAHDHATDCAVCHVLTAHAVDTFATVPLVVSDAPCFVLTPVSDVTPRTARLAPVHPRGPPAC